MNKFETLYYRGTSIAINLGDRISYRKIFRKVEGTVVYVPGQSEINRNMEYGDVRLWAIQLDGEKKDIRTMGFFPPGEVVPKKIEFLSRGNADQAISAFEEVV